MTGIKVQSLNGLAAERNEDFMKRIIRMILLSMVLLFSVSGVISPVISQAKEKQLAISKKNFPSEKVRFYLEENYDRNKNGKLSRKELKKATHIEFGGGWYTDKKGKSFAQIDGSSETVNLAGLHKLSYLKEIRIVDTDIKKTSELKKIKGLQVLEWDNYSEKNWTALKIDLKKFPDFKRLKVLSLKNFDVKHIYEVKKMKKLQNFTWYYHEKAKKKRKIDLKGFSKLKNLKVLGIGQVQVKHISEIKKMKKLQSLELIKNGLKKVDTSKNTKLVLLTLRNNPIKKVDLSANRKLEELQLWDTKVENFTLKDWGLKKLWLFYNKNLQQINIQNCTSLEFVRIFAEKRLDTVEMKGTPNMDYLCLATERNARLECDSMPKLKRLEIEKCNFNADLSLFPTLEKLSVRWNTLPKLDFSRTTKIKELYIYGCKGEQELDVSMLSELEKLTAKKSEFTKLNLGSHPNLKCVYCEQNKLTGTINFTETPQLYEFLCRQNQLTSLDMSKCKKLSVFNCSENNLKTVDVTGSWLYEFYCLANPGVQIRIVGTPDYYGWDKSAVVHWVSSSGSK